MKISACLIAKNEEKNIARCIESFKHVVNEIILVDTGSTDKTIEIAKELGAQVYYQGWENDFAKPRNFALDRAEGDWIIFLDADEYFSEKTAGNIPEILKKADLKKEIDSIMIRRQDIDTENSKVKHVEYSVRIFKNSRKIRYKGKIHENVYNGDEGMKAMVADGKALAIIHTGYSSEKIVLKFKRNLDLLLAELEDGNRDSMISFYLADCYAGLGEYSKAIDHARVFIDSNRITIGYNTKPYKTIINCMLKLSCRFDEVKAEIEKAIIKFPRHPVFYRLSAMLFQSVGKYEEALNAYKKTLEFQASYNDIESNDVPAYLSEINYNIGVIYKYKNDDIQALEYFVRSLQEDKNYSKALQQLMRLVSGQNSEDIIVLLNSIYDENNEMDVKFLVHELSELKCGEVLMYYTNIWYKKFGNEDSTIMFMLLSNSNYEGAFKYFSQCYLEEYSGWTALFSVISALLSENTEDIEFIKSIVKPSYKRIINAYTQNEIDQMLINADYGCYITLLKEFILLADENKLTKLLNVKYRFELDVSAPIGDIFKDNDRYRNAIDQYHEFMLRDHNITPSLYVKIGVCYYKLREYSDAVTAFEQALNMGYNNNDVRDLLCWIQDQSGDEQIKQRAANISEKYSVKADTKENILP